MEKVELRVSHAEDKKHKAGEFHARPFQSGAGLKPEDFMQNVIAGLAEIKQMSDEYLTAEMKRVSGDAPKRQKQQ